MTFSPAELSLLAISDQAESGGGGRGGRGVPRRRVFQAAEPKRITMAPIPMPEPVRMRPVVVPGFLGILTDARARELHRRGYGRASLAEAAGVSKERVAAWRKQQGLS